MGVTSCQEQGKHRDVCGVAPGTPQGKFRLEATFKLHLED